MNGFFKLILGAAVIWSSIYTASFAAHEFKNKRAAGGLTSLAAIAAMLLAYVNGIGF